MVSEFELLAQAIDGVVATRDSAVRPTFNARFDGIVPRAIVSCASTHDVAETVSFVRRHRLPVAIRSGGHCFAGRSSSRGLVIDVSPMRSLAVSDGLALIGAGARLGEVYLGLGQHGVTIPGGSCPSVGIAGLTLGGGLGMLGRTHGLTSDSLTAARMVLADGSVVRCDDGHHADLFWAVRGAGTGSFGVVTDLVFQPIAVPRTSVFELTWPFAAAADVVAAWVSWAGAAPEHVAASLVLAAGPEPAAAPTVEVFGTVLASASDVRAVLETFAARTDTDPDSALIEEMPYQDMLRHWASRAGETLELDGAAPPRGYHSAKSGFFARPIPDDVVDRLLHNFVEERRPGETRELDFAPWGGAYNRISTAATAFPHRDALFELKHEAMVSAGAEATSRASADEWTARSWATVHSCGTGGVFPNFSDLDLSDWGHAYYGSNYERLRSVKARYDPDDLFRSSQSIPRG